MAARETRHQRLHKILRIVGCAVFGGGLLQEDVEVQREKEKIPFVTEEFRESECDFEGENNK